MKHLQRAIENLKKKILSLCAVVEENVQMAVRSIQDRDPMLARRVIEEGIQIDQMEVDIEEECLKMLSLYQPVAIDLRFIVAVLKINSELERIGDLAENISERALFLVKHEKVNIPFDFPGMTEKTISMLNKSIDSLINMDATLAHEVCLADDEVDAINREMYKQIQDGIRQHIEHLESFIHLLGVSRHLERIADHATNIAEEVIYMITGEIVRHKTEEFC